MPLPGFFKGTEMPTAGWWEALFPEPAAIVAQVGIAPGMAAIDLCAGDGWFTLQIAKRARQVVAIDIDRALLDASRARLSELGVANCTFIAGNAYDLARLVAEPADFVFMANAFHGVPEQTRLAHEVAAALAPQGQFAILNWHARPREETMVLGEPRGPATGLRMTPQATISAVEPGGFRVKCTLEIPPYHYAAVFEKV